MIDNICISFIKDWLYSASADTDYTNTRLLGKQYHHLLTSDGLSLYRKYENTHYRITNNSVTNHRAYAKFTTR